MMLTVLHVIAIVLIVLVVVLYNFVLPGSKTEKISTITAVLTAVAILFSFVLFIYDKAVVG